MNKEDLQRYSESILHLFAVGYAERCLKKEVIAGGCPNPALWEALRVKRRWIEGSASNEELLKIRTRAYEIRDYNYLLRQSREARKIIRERSYVLAEIAWTVSWCVVDSLSKSGLVAATNVFLAKVVDPKDIGLKTFDKGWGEEMDKLSDKEELWQRNYLSSLEEQFYKNRVSFINCLKERKEQMLSLFKWRNWQEESEECLFLEVGC